MSYDYSALGPRGVIEAVKSRGHIIKADSHGCPLIVPKPPLPIPGGLAEAVEKHWPTISRMIGVAQAMEAREKPIGSLITGGER